MYWLDLLGSSALAWGTFLWSFVTPVSTPLYWVLVLVSSLAWIRAATFIHELSHRSARELPGFHFAWNLLVGVPITAPSFMGWHHGEHHRTATSGTLEDPEYAPVAEWSRSRLLGAVGIYVIVPWLLAVRFGFVALVSHLHPRLRAHAVGKISSNDIYAEYTRPPVPAERRRAFIGQEIACFALVWVGLVASIVGLLSWWFHVHRALVMTVSLVLNHARLLIQHRYEGGGRPGTLAEQALDAVTLGPDSPLTELISPVGSRYHALHHELPAVPYHALAAAHRLLMAELPADHPYRSTVVSGFWAGWALRWRDAGRLRVPEGR